MQIVLKTNTKQIDVKLVTCADPQKSLSCESMTWKTAILCSNFIQHYLKRLYDFPVSYHTIQEQ